MIKNSQIVTILILIFFFGCNSENEIIDPNYPTVIEELSDLEIEQIISQLEQTPLINCQSIDSYGFPIIDTDDTLCIDEDEWKADTSSTVIKEMAKQAFSDYASFLNITDTSEYQIKAITTSEGMTYSKFRSKYTDSLPPAWFVSTAIQEYEGIEVRGTTLQVLLSPDEAIGIRGHWYDDIYIPEEDVYSKEDAKELIYNTLYEYSGSEIIPTESSTWHTSKKIIVPVRESNYIEIRVCWAIYPDSWEFLIDSQTGDVISYLDVDEL